MTSLRNVRVNMQVNPGSEVLSAPDGELQVLQNVQHVSVFVPFNQSNGGPNQNTIYRIRAKDAVTGDNVDLQGMKFVGFAPHTGAARFADR